MQTAVRWLETHSDWSTIDDKDTRYDILSALVQSMNKGAIERSDWKRIKTDKQIDFMLVHANSYGEPAGISSYSQIKQLSYVTKPSANVFMFTVSCDVSDDGLYTIKPDRKEKLDKAADILVNSPHAEGISARSPVEKLGRDTETQAPGLQPAFKEGGTERPAPKKMGRPIKSDTGEVAKTYSFSLPPSLMAEVDEDLAPKESRSNYVEEAIRLKRSHDKALKLKR